ncbi:Mss4-like protein [Mucidula mucida]|nr:Mss4-like protein [Mucidula mucida]
MDSQATHEGSCFCGQTSWKIVGKPLLSAYCHCTLCQRITSSAFLHTMYFWPARSPVPSVKDKPWKGCHRCTKCGAVVTAHNARRGTWSFGSSQLARDENGKIKEWDYVKPTAHIFYGTRMLDINDQLGKWDGYENKSNRIG